ncbi:hypothetical protein B0T14DRAFT_21461 [Immersiella caudata]|uniref:Uncharacterized protein n=1 Tax=Immersiella caudata TaxID=314043 RepID=A0AA40CBG0_9PEZI|nr:hypothetical protein B0T14DRAFT_21461 [Immersiella caudata]
MKILRFSHTRLFRVSRCPRSSARLLPRLCAADLANLLPLMGTNTCSGSIRRRNPSVVSRSGDEVAHQAIRQAICDRCRGSLSSNPPPFRRTLHRPGLSRPDEAGINGFVMQENSTVRAGFQVGTPTCEGPLSLSILPRPPKPGTRSPRPSSRYRGGDGHANQLHRRPYWTIAGYLTRRRVRRRPSRSFPSHIVDLRMGCEGN